MAKSKKKDDRGGRDGRIGRPVRPNGFPSDRPRKPKPLLLFCAAALTAGWIFLLAGIAVWL